MGRSVAQKTCGIVVEGSELVELQRHAHDIPECPGLDRRIQRHDGNKPLVISLDELDWLVAVLDAVLHDPKGYPSPVLLIRKSDSRAVELHSAAITNKPAIPRMQRPAASTRETEEKPMPEDGTQQSANVLLGEIAALWTS